MQLQDSLLVECLYYCYYLCSLLKQIFINTTLLTCITYLNTTALHATCYYHRHVFVYAHTYARNCRCNLQLSTSTWPPTAPHHSINFHENRRLNCMWMHCWHLSHLKMCTMKRFLILRNNRNPSTSTRHCRAWSKTYAWNPTVGKAANTSIMTTNRYTCDWNILVYMYNMCSRSLFTLLWCK